MVDRLTAHTEQALADQRLPAARFQFSAGDSSIIDKIHGLCEILTRGVQSSKKWEAEREQDQEKTFCLDVYAQNGELDGLVCLRVGWKEAFEARDFLMLDRTPVSVYPVQARDVNFTSFPPTI